MTNDDTIARLTKERNEARAEVLTWTRIAEERRARWSAAAEMASKYIDKVARVEDLLTEWETEQASNRALIASGGFAIGGQIPTPERFRAALADPAAERPTPATTEAHRTRVTPQGGGFFRARCSCGWLTAGTYSEHEAEAATCVHIEEAGR